VGTAKEKKKSLFLDRNQEGVGKDKGVARNRTERISANVAKPSKSITNLDSTGGFGKKFVQRLQRGEGATKKKQKKRPQGGVVRNFKKAGERCREGEERVP